MPNKRGDYVPPLLREAGEVYDNKGRKIDSHADWIIDVRPDETPTPLDVLTNAVSHMDSCTADHNTSQQIVNAALRIAQRYPHLTKHDVEVATSSGVNMTGMVAAFTTTDYIIVARLALGLDT